MFWPFKKKKEKKDIFEVKKSNEMLETLKASKLAEKAFDITTKIYEQTGSRKAGHESSRKCARLLHEEFKQHSDDALITSFKSSESAYYGSIKLISISVPIILILSYFSLTILALIIFSFVTFTFVWEYIYCKGNDKTFFSKCDMTNVHATIEPSGECENTIIFTSHHDSAPLFNNEKSLMMSLYLPLIHWLALGLICVVVFITDIFTLGLLKIGLPPIFVVVLLVIMTITSFIYINLYKVISGEYSPGLGDNLISSCVVEELSRYFYWKKERGEGLKNTKLIFASFDGEECGLKGSKWWFEHHKEQLINPIVINLDCLYDASELTILTKDLNGLVNLSSSLAANTSSVCEKMGYKVKMGGMGMFCGSTDAASAARCGIDAISIVCTSMTPSDKSYFHTVDDTIDKIDKQTIEEVISICIKIVETNSKSEKPKEDLLALQDSEKKLIVMKK